jgi:hypothetical protein
MSEQNDNGIDLYKYGKLVATVESLEKKVDKLEKGMEELLELANQSRGGFWAGMAVVSAISSFVGFMAHWWNGK